MFLKVEPTIKIAKGDTNLMRFDGLPEALLEILYFPAFRALLEDHFGRTVLRILKPSQREEAYLGFDQGFVKTEISGADVRKQLAAAISSPEAPAPSLYVGYFLQYKCVEKMVRRSKLMPQSFQVPYYRFELSLKPNKVTGISQHDTLLRLHAVKGTDVSYVCPMIFSEDDLWRDASLDDVRVVSLEAASQSWASTDRHHVLFRGPNDPNPLWCSEPIRGTSRPFREWIAAETQTPQSGPAFLEWLDRIEEEVTQGESGAGLPSSLIIVEFEGKVRGLLSPHS